MSIGGKGKLKRLGGPRKTKKNSNDNSRPAKLYIPCICMEYLCTYIHHKFEATVGKCSITWEHLGIDIQVYSIFVGNSIYPIFIPELSGTGVLPLFFKISRISGRFFL